MPKIIEDVKNTILAEAKAQTLSHGYSSLTIRSVAKACGIAVGTIYNYFPSKDYLAASFLLADWLEILGEMKAGCEKAENPTEAFRIVKASIEKYRARYSAVFSDKSAEKSAGGVFQERHKMLRSQISELIAPICEKAGNTSSFLPDFIAETLLTWSGEDCDFDELNSILCRLF